MTASAQPENAPPEDVDRPPHLRHVTLKGFKSIQSLDLDLRPMNILIGANGSGKSNFISLFTFLSRLSQGMLRSYVARQGFGHTFFHFGPKTTPTISMDLDVGDNGYHVRFSHSAHDDSLVFDQEYCTFLGSKKQWPIKGSLGESGLLPDAEAASAAVRDYTQAYLQRCRVYHFHDTSAGAGFKQARELSAANFLYGDANNLAPFLYSLRKEFPRDYQNILQAIQTVAPFFHDFYLQPGGNEDNPTILLKWLHRDHDEPFSAHQLSDGSARFICLMTLLLQPRFLRPHTLVLDEPELGLHPVALEVLAEVMQATARHNQVICSTQSVYFANRFAAEDFIVVDQRRGASVFSRPDPEQLAEWLKEYGMGDLWDKNLFGGRPQW